MKETTNNSAKFYLLEFFYLGLYLLVEVVSDCFGLLGVFVVGSIEMLVIKV